MSVSIIDGITIRPWRGYDDPGLPVGMYFAQNSVVGDASGGEMFVVFCFKGEEEPVSGRFFNIEQINIFHSQPQSRLGAIVFNNWETLASPVGLVNRHWKFRLDSNTFVSALDGAGYFPLPIFLGAAGTVPQLTTDVQISVNNVDITSLTCTIQGYIWDPGQSKRRAACDGL